MVGLVIFDADNVVVHYDRARRVAVMAERLGRTDDEVWAAVFTSGIEDAADAGELGPDAYLQAVGAQLGTPVSREVWVAAPTDALFVDDSAEYVEGARRAGLRAHVFTGIDGLVGFLTAEGVEVPPDSLSP